ncbi:metal-sulfur cluster assembly factor [Candidatus Gottesmanbacteria bacterium]|nr:metal-sulfur cluster assembly factor [Candidatus Gottesmanbacteria bacterium]
MVNKEIIWEELRNIPDPELGISIVDLGLIYDVKTDDKGVVDIRMTLTTMGCPLFELIAGPVQENLKKIKGVKKVNVDLTFEPPWSPEKMSEEAKVKLGFF